MEIKKYDYSPWLNQYQENLPMYEEELKRNKKDFEDVKNKIIEKYSDYLKLVEKNKKIKISKSIVDDIKKYNFKGDNYPWELFNVCGSEREYFGYDRWSNKNKISKKVKDKVLEIEKLFNDLQHLNLKGPDSHNYRCYKGKEDLHKYEENAIHIFGKCLIDCEGYLIKVLKENNLKLSNNHFYYKNATQYSNNPSSFNLRFKNISNEQIRLIKQIINEVGFELVKDEIVKRNIIEDVGDDLVRVSNNYICSIYCREINEVNNVPKLFME